MDQTEEIDREKFAALRQVRAITKFAREDIGPCMIEEGLYLGSLGSASNKSALKTKNITHILVVRSPASTYLDDFIYKIITVQDNQDANIIEYFDECYNFIEEAKRTGGGVLVHCFLGRSRSVTVVIAYLMRKYGMRLSEALELVKKRRPVASPNRGFMIQLQDYENTLRGKLPSSWMSPY